MESSYGSMDYEAAERTFHFCRRRRWVRERENVDGVITNIAPKVIIDFHTQSALIL